MLKTWQGLNKLAALNFPPIKTIATVYVIQTSDYRIQADIKSLATIMVGSSGKQEQEMQTCEAHIEEKLACLQNH